MENKYKIIYFETARNDINELLSYIKVKLCNPNAAEAIAAKLIQLIHTAAEFPYSGLLVDNEFFIDQSLRKILVDNYVIFYKIEEDNNAIVVLRVIYGSRNLHEILKEI